MSKNFQFLGLISFPANYLKPLIGIALVVGGVFGGFQLFSGFRVQQQQMQTDIDTVSKVVNTTLAYAISEWDHYLLEQLLEGVLEFPAIVEATVLDNEGRILAYQQKFLNHAERPWFNDALFGNQHSISIPLVYQLKKQNGESMKNPPIIGQLSLVVDHFYYSSRFTERIFTTFLKGFLFSFVIVIVILFFLQHQLNQAFVWFNHQLELIKFSRDGTQRVNLPEDHPYPEFFQIASSFNHLVSLVEQHLDNHLKSSKALEQLQMEYQEKHQQMMMLKDYQEQLEKVNKHLTESLSSTSRTHQFMTMQEKLESFGRVTAGISHEMKSPLSQITNFTRLGEASLKDLQGQLEKVEFNNKESVDASLRVIQKTMDTIDKQGKRIDTILESMLFADQEKLPTHFVQIHDLIEEFYTLAYYNVHAQDFPLTIKKTFQFDKSIGEIEVISQDLGRVFLNIISNAFQAIMEKQKVYPSNDYQPEINVRTQSLGEQVEVRIWDNGIGIVPSYLSKIFDPFFSTLPLGIGSGLGLSLSYEIIVRAHKGDIGVESERGRYTEVTITLPKYMGMKL